MSILITGGTGYIGSHTVVSLIDAGMKDIVIVDNLSNSSASTIDKIFEITGVRPKFYNFDLRDKKLLQDVFANNEIESVIHFAGLKSVGESISMPIAYYDNNLISTLTLCNVMAEYGCKKMVFSSTANVYGVPKTVPIKEDFQTITTNPYGSSKLFVEQILRDIFISDDSWKIILLRYFNPVGAHKSGLIGENPKGIPNNLMPFIAKVAVGELPYLNVWGNDYDTVDGTGVRDYIHVCDLAYGHIKALEKIDQLSDLQIFNIGTGRGYSVLEMVRAFEVANNVKIPYKIAPRRLGDAGSAYADTTKAFLELGFKAQYTIEEMCKDGYNFILQQSQ